MYLDLDVPAHFAGIISMIVAGGTVVSSLFSARLISRFWVASITTAGKLIGAIDEVLEGGAPMSPTIARKVMEKLQGAVTEQFRPV